MKKSANPVYDKYKHIPLLVVNLINSMGKNIGEIAYGLMRGVAVSQDLQVEGHPLRITLLPINFEAPENTEGALAVNPETGLPEIILFRVPATLIEYILHPATFHILSHELIHFYQRYVWKYPHREDYPYEEQNAEVEAFVKSTPLAIIADNMFRMMHEPDYTIRKSIPTFKQYVKYLSLFDDKASLIKRKALSESKDAYAFALSEIKKRHKELKAHRRKMKKNPIPAPGTKAHEEYLREQADEMSFYNNQRLNEIPVDEANEIMREYREERAAMKAAKSSQDVLEKKPELKTEPKMTVSKAEADDEEPFYNNITYPLYVDVSIDKLTPDEFISYIRDSEIRVEVLTKFITGIVNKYRSINWLKKVYGEETISHLVGIDNIEGSHLKHVATELMYKCLVPEFEIVQWLKNNHYFELEVKGTIPLDGITWNRLDTVEVNLSGRRGTVNRVDTDDVYKTMMADIPPEEQETVRDNLFKQYLEWYPSLNQVTIKRPNNLWIRMTPRLLIDWFLTKNFIAKKYWTLCYVYYRYHIASGGGPNMSLELKQAKLAQNLFTSTVTELKNMPLYFSDPDIISIENDAWDVAQKSDQRGEPLPDLNLIDPH